MSKGLQWVIGIGIGVVVAAVILSVVWPFVAPQSGWTGGYGSMMGPGHMQGWGMPGVFGMGFFGLGMFLWPLLFLGLIVLAGVALVRAIGNTGPSTPTLACPHCGRPIQAGWKACPNCGEKL